MAAQEDKPAPVIVPRFSGVGDYYYNIWHKLKGNALVLKYEFKDDNGRTLKTKMYLNPIYAKIIKLIVRYLLDLYNSGIAIKETFDLTHIYWEDHLSNVEWQELIWCGLDDIFCNKGFCNEGFCNEGSIRLIGMHSCDASPEAMKHNFMNLAQIIRNLFSDESIPRDIHRWLRLIGRLTYDNKHEGELLCHHVSLMSSKEAVLFFMSCDTAVPKLDSRHLLRYDKAIDQMAKWQMIIRK